MEAASLEARMTNPAFAVPDAYPALMDHRLAGTRVALAFAGPVDGRMRGQVEKALQDSGADAPLRVRALKLPIDLAAMRKTLARHPALVLLLAGGPPGNYGVKKTAHDGVLPSIPISGG